MTPEQEQEYRAEAERLKLLPKLTQLDLIAMHRHKSRNAKLSAAERKAAAEKADNLARLLGHSRSKRSV